MTKRTITTKKMKDTEIILTEVYLRRMQQRYVEKQKELENEPERATTMFGKKHIILL